MKRVVIVDDDFMVASIHRGYVERVDGFVVVGEAHCGQEALDIIASVRPDVVLLDIYLPDMTGIDVMRRVRSQTECDFIAITAARDVDVLRAAIRFGAIHYLVKPFTFPMLRDKLNQYEAWDQALDQATITGQPEVDRLVGVLRTDTRAAKLPKGLSQPTRDLIERIVREARRELTSEEVAMAASVSRVTARRYLEYLRDINVVTMRARYGASGRPVHLFSALTQPSA